MAPKKRKTATTQCNKYSRNKEEKHKRNAYNGKGSSGNVKTDNSTFSETLLEDTEDILPLSQSPLTNTVIETSPKRRKNNHTSEDDMDSSESSVSEDVSEKEKTKTDTVSSKSKTEETKFNCLMEKTSIIKTILQNQQLLFQKIEILSNQLSGQSSFSPNENLFIVRLSNEQKSIISQLMRKQFNKIKFLRDEEWNFGGNLLLDPLFEKLCITDDKDKSSYCNAVKSYATACINQKRAEVMRNLKQNTKGLYKICITPDKLASTKTVCCLKPC